MPPQDNSVWISREEYERLKQAEQTAANQIAPTPYVSSPAYDDPAQSPALQTMRRQQTVVSAVLGIAFVIALTVPGLGWLAGIVVTIFIIFALTSLFQYQRTKRRVTKGDIPQPRSAVKLVLIVLGCILLLPVLAYAGMLVLFVILFSAGGGGGS